MKKVLPLLFLLLLAASCKKERLVDNKEILVGEWEWIGSEVTYPGGSGSPSSYGTITPDQLVKTYTIKFYKKGRMEIFQNGEEIYGKRTIVESWNENPSGHNLDLSFTITNLSSPRNEEHIDFSGTFNNYSTDTLFMRTIPFEEYQTAGSGGLSSYNIFVRK